MRVYGIFFNRESDIQSYDHDNFREALAYQPLLFSVVASNKSLTNSLTSSGADKLPITKSYPTPLHRLFIQDINFRPRISFLKVSRLEISERSGNSSSQCVATKNSGYLLFLFSPSLNQDTISSTSRLILSLLGSRPPAVSRDRKRYSTASASSTTAFHSS